MKKKLVIIFMVVALALSVTLIATACNQSDDFTVGAIYITNQSETSGYTYAHHAGITKAMNDLGLSPSSNLKIVDDVPEDKTAVGNAIDTLVNQGCDMIIGISFGYLFAFDEKAEEYPDIIFSHATGYLSNETNFNNYFGRIYQARYLAGIAAGLKALALEEPKLGYVAAWGLEYAETASGINAFALGAQSVYPEAQLYVKKISTWGDQTKERQAAQSLADMGCVVIAQHCDSAQPQIVAEENDIFGCGYNSNMTAEAPAAHLTAPIWNWDVYYKTAIQAAKDKGVEGYIAEIGQAWFGGLKEGFVDISPLTTNVEAGTESAITQVKTLMIKWQNGEAGGFNVFEDNKLSIAIADGVATVVSNAAPLLKADNTAAGAIDDGVIKGSMNYYVLGVQEV